jgi:hypothetical protein
MALFVLKTAPSLARIPCPFLDIYHRGVLFGGVRAMKRGNYGERLEQELNSDEKTD